MPQMALVLTCLAVPAAHQVLGHRVGLRAVRTTPTAHELRHRARPLRLRLAADAAWLTYLACVLVLAFVIR